MPNRAAAQARPRCAGSHGRVERGRARTVMTVGANQLPASARQVVDAAASAGGVLLAAAFGTLARARGGRPLHPQGATYAATVAMTGQGLSGAPWLDDRGLHRVTVRVSRSA